ncbi:hypothetical protein NQ314_018668 [Rhamnusium bicolor]|uniref:DUF5641 domain-containing protein n=1 Tax=Rhamnusium bicolor TaxID=1586634 RepID=A0AAV8WQE3_9CUCU|nr:hypothetical protein NQ314_018668 [Rhamnusium bicolor]
MDKLGKSWQLHQISKKHYKTECVKKCDVVLIANDNSKRLWPLAIVQDLLPGKDEVRRVRLKTAGGTMLRPIIQRLCLIETTPWESKNIFKIDVDVKTKEKTETDPRGESKETLTEPIRQVKLARKGRKINTPEKYFPENAILDSNESLVFEDVGVPLLTDENQLNESLKTILFNVTEAEKEHNVLNIEEEACIIMDNETLNCDNNAHNRVEEGRVHLEQNKDDNAYSNLIQEVSLSMEVLQEEGPSTEKYKKLFILAENTTANRQKRQ